MVDEQPNDAVGSQKGGELPPPDDTTHEELVEHSCSVLVAPGEGPTSFGQYLIPDDYGVAVLEWDPRTKLYEVAYYLDEEIDTIVMELTAYRYGRGAATDVREMISTHQPLSGPQ